MPCRHEALLGTFTGCAVKHRELCLITAPPSGLYRMLGAAPAGVLDSGMLGTLVVSLPPTWHKLPAPPPPHPPPTPLGRKSFPFIFTADCVLMAVGSGKGLGGAGPEAMAAAERSRADARDPCQGAAVGDDLELHTCSVCPRANRLVQPAPCLQGVYAWKGLIPGIGGGDGEQQS